MKIWNQKGAICIYIFAPQPYSKSLPPYIYAGKIQFGYFFQQNFRKQTGFKFATKINLIKCHRVVFYEIMNRPTSMNYTDLKKINANKLPKVPPTICHQKYRFGSFCVKIRQ